MEILTTKGITIMVETQYLPEHSNPREHRFIFGYHITIKNGSDYTVQLMRRHWFIYDATGNIREVEGEGVIGLQPVLKPGETHEYASYCDLPTDMGKMHGAYLMNCHDDDSFFQVAIPLFKLYDPAKLN
ncbi:MAG: Co2+/Mg2+ efflux protein ApaG [Saprospiraceae bacterium]|nr:Co2+/Mg2+ efflux protein ApaG [Saprospiraceae bacterium]